MRPIFCGNVEFDARQSDIERLFRRYGRVERVDMKSGKLFSTFVIISVLILNCSQATFVVQLLVSGYPLLLYLMYNGLWLPISCSFVHFKIILSGRSIRKSELFLNPLVAVILLITISYISPWFMVFIIYFWLYHDD
jgi:RNA recognition motif-containing protein